MPSVRHCLQKHTYAVHSIAFASMVFASLGLYFAANTGSLVWTWVLLGIFGFANVLVLFVK